MHKLSDPSNPILNTQASLVSFDPKQKITRIVNIWEAGQGRSLYELMPEKFRKCMDECRRERPDLFELDEQSLVRKLKRENKAPNSVVRRLRMKMWVEYDRAQEVGAEKMELVAIQGSVCDVGLFYKIAERPEMMSFMVTPPQAYVERLEELLELGAENLREILDLPLVNRRMAKDKHGKLREEEFINVKLAELQLKIYALVELRLKGSVAQKTMSVNYHEVAETPNKLVKYKTVEEIETRIKELEKMSRSDEKKGFDPMTIEMEPKEYIPLDDDMIAEDVELKSAKPV